MIDPPYLGHLVLRAGHQNDPVRLDALVLSHLQQGLFLTILIDEHPAETVAGGPSLFVAKLDQTTRSLKNLGGEFEAASACHHALHHLAHVRHHAAVVLELLRAVVHGNSLAATDELVVGTFVGVLESTPTAHVIDEDRAELPFSGFDVGDHPREGLTSFDLKTAFPLVRIHPDDLHPPPGRIIPNHIHLIARRVLLVLGGHPDIGGHLEQWLFHEQTFGCRGHRPNPCTRSPLFEM